MSLRTPQVIALAGIIPTLVAAEAGGDEFVNSGRDFIHVKNSGAETTVIINSQVNCSQGVDHDVTVTIPLTTGWKMIGPFPKDRFNDTAGKVQITYGDHTNLTIGIVRLP